MRIRRIIVFELIEKSSGQVERTDIAYAPLEAQADPLYYLIRNTKTGVTWDDWGVH